MTVHLFTCGHTTNSSPVHVISVMLDDVTKAIAACYGWITLFIATTALIYWFGVSGYSLISHIPLPGPKPWPYVGNILEVAKHGGLHKAFVEFGKRYGKVYKMYLGRSPMITVADPEMLKYILVKDFDKFRNRPDFMRSNPPLDIGLFSARDHSWRRIRSIVSPTFSLSKLKEIVPIIEDAAGLLLNKLVKSAENGKQTTLFMQILKIDHGVSRKGASLQMAIFPCN